MYGRLENLIDYKKLFNKNILLVGTGGVGSFCFEILIRSGIKNITIIDFDTYELSNLNRQLYSNSQNIGCKKIEILKNNAKLLNDEINIEAIDLFLDSNTNIDLNKYDYIIDACDSIDAKVYLIKYAIENNIKIITSLGVGNRMDPTKLKIEKLSKTYNDPLAKKLRNRLNKDNININNIITLFSSEVPQKGPKISSYIGVTSYAGILIADFVIKELLNEN